MGRYDRVRITIRYGGEIQRAVRVGPDEFTQYLPDSVMEAIWAEYGRPDEMYLREDAFEEGDGAWYGHTLSWKAEKFAIVYEGLFAG
jgi:hypothetical protein